MRRRGGVRAWYEAGQSGSDDEPGCDEDDVFDDVLALERRRVVRPGEQPGGEQCQRGEDADQLPGEQVETSGIKFAGKCRFPGTSRKNKSA